MRKSHLACLVNQSDWKSGIPEASAPTLKGTQPEKLTNAENKGRIKHDSLALPHEARATTVLSGEMGEADARVAASRRPEKRLARQRKRQAEAGARFADGNALLRVLADTHSYFRLSRKSLFLPFKNQSLIFIPKLTQTFLSTFF